MEPPRDRNGRFRSVDTNASLCSVDYATVGLRERIAKAVTVDDLVLLGIQGDETRRTSPPTCSRSGWERRRRIFILTLSDCSKRRAVRQRALS